jgi:lipopolysaccharide transport system permease protein
LRSSSSEPVAAQQERTFETPLDRRPVSVRRRFRDTVDLLISLTASDLRSRYGRGPFVVVRWIVEPFALVGVYLVLLAVVLKKPGHAPGLSLACAIVPFQLIMLAVTNAMTAVNIRRPIITNMRFRRTLIPVSSVLTESSAFAASFGVIILMMAVYAVPPTAALLWLPIVIATTLIFATSFAYPASLFGLWFWELRPFLVSIVRIMFFIGPGLVPLSQASERTREYLRLNPLTGLFESFRDVFFYGRSPAAWQLLYPLAFALFLLAVFVPLYRRDQREFAKVVQ